MRRGGSGGASGRRPSSSVASAQPRCPRHGFPSSRRPDPREWIAHSIRAGVPQPMPPSPTRAVGPIRLSIAVTDMESSFSAGLATGGVASRGCEFYVLANAGSAVTTAEVQVPSLRTRLEGQQVAM